jgi:hypothetical protein
VVDWGVKPSVVFPLIISSSVDTVRAGMEAVQYKEKVIHAVDVFSQSEDNFICGDLATLLGPSPDFEYASICQVVS